MRQIILTASYWLTLRPLATYPGPFLAKVCDAYSAYHGWNQSTHLDALRRHETYGDFVPSGPNRVLVTW